MNNKILLFGSLALTFILIVVVLITQKNEDIKTTSPIIENEKKQEIVNLPKLEEQNYKILNDRIVKLTKQLNVLRSNDSSLINAEYQKISKELEQLQAKNEQLEALNNELNGKLSNGKIVNISGKNGYEERFEKLSEELATYKSENDSLKLALNDKENIVNNLNSLINTLSNQKQMNEFEHDNIARKLQTELEKANVKIEANKKNYSDIIKENEILKQRIESLAGLENTNTELSKVNNELSLKNIELSQELKAISKLNSYLKNNKNSDIAMLNLDNKNLQVKLEDAKTSILKINQEKEDLQTKLNEMKEFEKQNEKLKNELFQTKLEFEKYKSDNAINMKELSEKNQISLDKINKEMIAVNDMNAKLKTNLEKSEMTLKNLQFKNNELELDLKNKEKIINENSQKFIKESENLKTALAKNEELKDKLDSIQKEKLDLSTQISNINAEFLTYKNESLNNQKQNITKLEQKLKDSLKSYDELNARYLSLKEDNATREIKLKIAENDKLALENEIEQLKLTIQNDKNPEKVIALEEEKNNLLNRINDLNLKILNNYNKDNSELAIKKEKILELEKKLELAQKNSSFNTENLKLLETFTCDDVRAGTTNLSKACELGLDKLLAKYDNSYLFEITPIIDNGGFKSLSVIDGTHMASDEVRRLTRLANFGLSKDRVKSAAEYVKSKIKNALVISSLEAQYSNNNKKGFLIRVYK